MDASCVLVMNNDWLMKRALASILENAGRELKVCISEAGDVTSLSADIAQLDAGVVFLRESMPLAENSAILQLLTAQPNLKVIVVSDESNWLRIFHKEDRLLGSLPELINLIQAA